jgi:hypothetical protein
MALAIRINGELCGKGLNRKGREGLRKGRKERPQTGAGKI